MHYLMISILAMLTSFEFVPFWIASKILVFFAGLNLVLFIIHAKRVQPMIRRLILREASLIDKGE